VPFKPSSHDVRYIGHASNSGGLQGHSIGADYPFVVVGTVVEHMGVGEKPGEHTRYFILDASNGKTYTKRFGRTYATSKGAHAAAAYLKGDEKYAHIATTPLRPTLWTS
jgi:hypothetical protein